MRLKILFLAMICMTVLGFAQDESITLQQCIDLAMRNNPGLDKARLDVLISSQDVKQSGSDLLPTVAFSGTYRRQSEVPSFEIPEISTPLGSFNIFPNGKMSLGSLDTYDFKITAAQPLFTGLRLKNRQKAGEAVYENKQLAYERLKSEMVFRVESAYRTVQKTLKILEITRNGKEQVELHLRDVQNYYDQGLARNDELLKVQVKLSEAELAVVQAQNAVEMALAYLENLTGQAVASTQIVPVTNVPKLEQVQIAETLEIAYSQRMELKELLALKQAAILSEKIARGEFLPTISAFASLGYGKPGLNFVNDEWMDYWVAGLGVDMPLWNWGKTSSKVQSAKLNTQKVDQSIKEVKQAIKLDVSNTCLQVNEVLQRLELTTRMENQAFESFRITENNYKNGQAGNSDFLDSQFDLTRARLQRAQAEIDFILSLTNLVRAEGGSHIIE